MKMTKTDLTVEENDVAPTNQITTLENDPGVHESQERRARRLFDEMARNIGREAVNHLKAMYPAALAAVPKSAEISLTNHVRNDVNWRMRPLLMAMIAMHREWEEERTAEVNADVNDDEDASTSG